MVNYYQKKQCKFLAATLVICVVIVVLIFSVEVLFDSKVEYQKIGKSIDTKQTNLEKVEVNIDQLSESELSSITQKDLFRNSRKNSEPRPPKPVVPIKDKSIQNRKDKRVQSINSSNLSKIKLIGIVLVGEQKVAVFYDKNKNIKINRAIGEDINGWKISSITKVQVVLSKNGQEIVKEIVREKNNGSSGNGVFGSNRRMGTYR